MTFLYVNICITIYIIYFIKLKTYKMIGYLSYKIMRTVNVYVYINIYP